MPSYDHVKHKFQFDFLRMFRFNTCIHYFESAMTEHSTPGQLIAALLEERGWTIRTLAVVLEKDDSTIQKIIAGKGSVTTETALALEDIFKVDAERFLELQRKYDLAVARLTSKPDQGRANRAALLGDLPIAAMIKRGWIAAKDVSDLKAVEAELIKFFGVTSINEIEVLPHAAKKTYANQEPSPAQLAWLYRVKAMAAEMVVSKYSHSAVVAAIPKLKALLASPEEARKVPRILAEAGVRFLLVESLPSAKIDGVCFWLGNAPVVALSMRFDRIDNFWFVLRHELEHVIHEHGRTKTMLDVELDGSDGIDDEERIANSAAAEFCVSQDKLKRFIDRKSPFFAERDIQGFAATIGVHPGLIAGQLHHKTGRHDRFRSHCVGVRQHVAPSAIVDGWGDVYPIGT